MVFHGFGSAASPSPAQLWFGRSEILAAFYGPVSGLFWLAWGPFCFFYPDFSNVPSPTGYVDGTGWGFPFVGDWISSASSFFAKSAAWIFSCQPYSIVDWVGTASFTGWFWPFTGRWCWAGNGRLVPQTSTYIFFWRWSKSTTEPPCSLDFLRSPVARSYIEYRPIWFEKVGPPSVGFTQTLINFEIWSRRSRSSQGLGPWMLIKQLIKVIQEPQTMLKATVPSSTCKVW